MTSAVHRTSAGRFDPTWGRVARAILVVSLADPHLAQDRVPMGAPGQGRGCLSEPRSGVPHVSARKWRGDTGEPSRLLPGKRRRGWRTHRAAVRVHFGFPGATGRAGRHPDPSCTSFSGVGVVHQRAGGVPVCVDPGEQDRPGSAGGRDTWAHVRHGVAAFLNPCPRRSVACATWCSCSDSWPPLSSS